MKLRWTCTRMMGGEKLMIWSTSSVKHGGVCMDASEDRLLEFIDDAIADSSNILNCGVYRAVLAAQIQSNPANRLAAVSQCKWTMTWSKLEKQPKSFSGQRNEIFFNWQISDLTSNQQSSFSVSEDKTEGWSTHKQAAACLRVNLALS